MRHQSTSSGDLAKSWQDDTTRPSCETSIPWTASRCQRLVRPLESRLLALKKLRDQEKVAQHGSNAESNDQAGHGPRDLNHANECGPTPGRRLRHTYKQRARRKVITNIGEEAVQGQPGNQVKRPWPKLSATPSRTRQMGFLNIPTPVLRRARALLQISPEPISKGVLPEAVSNKTELAVEMWKRTLLPSHKLRARMSPEHLRCHELLYRDFAYFIHATSAEATTAGQKSLLAMCLRAMPAHIEMVSIDELDDDDGRGNTAAQRLSTAATYLFEDLESFGHDGPGWVHLRLALRAYGLHILAKAVSEGLIDNEAVWSMVRLCSASSAIQESETLLDAMLGQDAFPKPRTLTSDWTEDQALAPLRMLQWHTFKCNREQYLLRQLSILISRGQLPSTWLSTKAFQDIWTSTARRLSDTQGCRDSVEFLTLAMRQLCQPGTVAFPPQRKTLVSLLGLLAALSIYTNDRHNGASSRTVYRTPTAASRQLAVVFHNCLSGNRPPDSHIGRVDKFAFAVATFISFGRAQVSTLVTDEAEGVIRRVLSKFPECRPQDRREYYDATSSLLSAIAANCSKGLRLSSHEYLSTIIDDLKTLETAPGLLDTVATDSAFVLAQRTKDPKDLRFAEQLKWKERQAKEDFDRGRQTRNATLFSGYRWEEGISEWVTESPVRTKRTRGSMPVFGTRPTRQLPRRERIKPGQLSNFIADSLEESSDDEQATSVAELAGQPRGSLPRPGTLLLKTGASGRVVAVKGTSIISAHQGPKRRRAESLGSGRKFQKLDLGKRRSSGCVSSDDELAL